MLTSLDTLLETIATIKQLAISIDVDPGYAVQMAPSYLDRFFRERAMKEFGYALLRDPSLNMCFTEDSVRRDHTLNLNRVYRTRIMHPQDYQRLNQALQVFMHEKEMDWVKELGRPLDAD